MSEVTPKRPSGGKVIYDASVSVFGAANKVVQSKRALGVEPLASVEKRGIGSVGKSGDLRVFLVQKMHEL